MRKVWVRCREHRLVMGMVKQSPGGFPSYQARDYSLPAEPSWPIDDTSLTNLQIGSIAEVDAWCRRCGHRSVPTADLRDALEGRRASTILI